MADELPVHKNIFEAKLAIMRDVPYIQKTGRMKSEKMNFTFASEQDVIEAVRPSMVLHQVVITRQAMARDGAYIICIYSFTHVPTGSSEQIVTLGDIESGAKGGGYKAMTGSQKYAIRQWLMIETGDDPDKSRGKDNDDGDAPAEGLQKRIAAGVKQIMESTTLKELDVHTKRIAKSSDEVKGPLMNALAKRRDEIISTTEAGSNG